MTDLGTFSPSAVNLHGAIAGSYQGHPAVYDHGAITILSDLQGGVTSINDHGEMVGTLYVPPDGTIPDYTLPAYWYGGAMFPLEPHATVPLSISNGHVIAGFSAPGEFPQGWRRWPDGRLEFLRAQASTYANAVNSQGQVAATFNSRAVRWELDGSVVDLGTLGGQYASAVAINDAGVMIGMSEGRPFRTTVTGMIELPRPPGMVGCWVNGMNQHGAVVGACSHPGRTDHWYDDTDHATLWTPDGFPIDLSAHLQGHSHAVAVGDAGHIVGTGVIPFERGYGWLLTPIPEEPPAVALSVNEEAFMPGGTLHVSVERSDGPADLHVAIILPDGVTTLFLTSMESPGYLVSTIAEGPYPVTSGQLLTHTWSGLEPSGTYHIVAALAKPGSLQDGSIDEGDVLALTWAPVFVHPGVGGLVAGR